MVWICGVHLLCLLCWHHAIAHVLIGSPTGSDQSKEVIFPESPSPTFLTVPGEGFAEPFELTPGKWIIYLRAEGILLVS